MTPDVPDYAHSANWLERYRRAWIERNAADAGELFAEDAIYREQPFGHRSLDAKQFHGTGRLLTATQSEIEMRYGPLIVGNRRVAVEWWVNLRNSSAPITLVGEFFLVFTDGGQCRELREYWTLTEGRVEPPDWWEDGVRSETSS